MYSCKSSKELQEEHVILIMLKDKLSGDYISSGYETFQPSTVKPSNKTLNQYRAIFSCSDTEKDKLMLMLSNDPNIISVNQENKNSPTIQSSTSGKVIRSKPGSSKR